MSRPKKWESEFNEECGIATVTFSSWKWFPDYINNELLEYTGFIYRGHGDSCWLLEPTLDRVVKDPESELREKHLTNFKYETRGRRGTNPPIMASENDWWALGQHHGLLTPLLDWSESPFVAFYFAIAKALELKSKSCSVFCLFQPSVEEINDQIKGDDNIEKINGQKPTIKVFKPLSDENDRLVSQRGLFTRGPNNIDIEDWFNTYQKSSKYMDVIKFVIPCKNLDDAMAYLNRMNINPSTLFPDLSGASRYCNFGLDIDNYR